MPREAVKDAQFRVLGWYDHQGNGDILVYDAINRYLGRATQSGTFDAQNKNISPNKEPGLLLRP